MGGVFFIFVIVIFAAILIPLSIAHNRSVDDAWATAARRLGLQNRPSGFMTSRAIQGELHGYYVNVDIYTVRRNKRTTSYTQFRIGYPSLGMGLSLKQEGFFTGVTKLFGTQDIKVGDQNFDDSVLIQGHSAARVVDFLTSSRRMRIARFFSGHKGATIRDGEIHWRRVGVISDPGTLENKIRSFVRLAHHLTKDDPDDALENALQAQDNGRLDESFQLIHDHLGNEEERGPEEDVLEAELLYIAGREQEAQEMFAKAQEESPEDPEIQLWQEFLTDQPNADAKENAEAGQPDAAEEPPAAHPIEVTDELSPEVICGALFGQHQTSFQVTRRFEELYQGQSVEWTGTLRRAEPYSHDFVFGSGPGCRAIVTVHQLESTLYGDQLVTAIVKLPSDAYDELRDKVGEQIAVRGQLKKVDGLMRNIFIEPAS